MYFIIKPVKARHTKSIKLTKSTTKFNVPRFIISNKADLQNPAGLQYYQITHFRIAFVEVKQNRVKNGCFGGKASSNRI